jgi:hypothetical protein
MYYLVSSFFTTAPCQLFYSILFYMVNPSQFTTTAHNMSVRKVLGSQPFLITANVLAGILSIVIIGLVADNLAWLQTSDAKTGVSTIGFNITINETAAYDTAVVAHLPVDVRTGSYWLMLAAGIGGFIDALVLGGMLCWRRLKSFSLQVEHGEVSRR